MNRAANDSAIQPSEAADEEPATPPVGRAGDVAPADLAAQAWPPLAAEDLAARLAPYGTRRTFRANDVVLYEGDPDNAVRLVLAGWVRESIVTEDGREVLLGIRGPGELLGLDAALRRRPQASSVRALEPVSCVQIGGARFEAVMRSDPDVAVEVARRLSARVRELSLVMTDRVNLDGSRRVAKVLLELAAQSNQSDSDGSPTIGRMSQEDIASMAGLARRTTARALRMFRERDIISTDARRITILEPRILRLFVGSEPRV
jgi:CRP-like cAMP-binding protein